MQNEISFYNNLTTTRLCQPIKTLLGRPFFFAFWLLAATCSWAQHTSVGLSKPYILQSTDQAFVFELALTLPSSASANNTTDFDTAQLASPEAHWQRGLNYPLWLKDAAYQLRQTPLERPTLRITAQRGSPDRTSDFLLEFKLQGRRYLQPYHLILEKNSTFIGAPLPEMPPAAPDVAAYVAPHVASIAPTNATPTHAAPANATPSPRAKTRAPSKPPKSPTPPEATNEPPPNIPPTETAAPATSIIPTDPPVLTTPMAPTRAMPATPAKPATLTSFWLPALPWQWWGFVGAVIALLGYLAVRMLRSKPGKALKDGAWQPQATPFGASQVSATHLDSSQTGSFANTVFGLDEKQADNMRQQWFSQKNQTK